MKKTFEGHLFNRLEKIGDKEYNHVGCEGKTKEFINFLTQFVPEVGMKRKVRFTVESKSEPEIKQDYKISKDYSKNNNDSGQNSDEK